MVNSKIGEVYILGIKNKKKQKITKFIEITSKKNGKIKCINLKDGRYVDARILLDENLERRHWSDNTLENIEDIQFIFFVTKKWPDLNLDNLKPKNVNFIIYSKFLLCYFYFFIIFLSILIVLFLLFLLIFLLYYFSVDCRHRF